jgi:hypothetical protein
MAFALVSFGNRIMLGPVRFEILLCHRVKLGGCLLGCEAPGIGRQRFGLRLFSHVMLPY